MHHPDRQTDEHWEKLLEDIDLGIAQMAMVCRVPLLEPGVAERVLNRDSSVCGVDNPAVFAKLRALLVMHYTAEREIAESIGPERATDIAQHVREHLLKRVAPEIERMRDKDKD